MNWFQRTFNYSIGRKLIMALTGLFLYSFLFVHVGGNFQLFMNDNGQAFNEYSHFMTSNPIIRIVEIGLFGSFFIHIIQGFMLYFKNKKSRPVRYEGQKFRKDISASSRFMIISGSIILIFLVIHIGGIYVPYRITGVKPDAYQLTKEVISQPIFGLLYILGTVMICWHLHHGVGSALQTLGLRHPNFYTAIKTISFILTVGIAAGFASMPIYFMMNAN